MKTKKNFYIVRFCLLGKCITALKIKKKDWEQFWPFFKKVEKNNAGGKTMWFDVDIDPEYKKNLFK